MNRSRRHDRSRGFATTFALFLVILVTGALLALTNLSVADARRTTAEAMEAQVRQLVRAALQEQPLETGVMPLPAELAGRERASVRIARDVRDSTSELVVRIEVRLLDRTVKQTFPATGASAGTPRGEGRDVPAGE